MPANVVERSNEVSAQVRDLERRMLAQERQEWPTGSYRAGVDVYPDGETGFGIWARDVNRAGIDAYTSHHRSGTAPTGLSWAEGSGWGGDASVQWNRRASFMLWEMEAPPHLLYAAVGTYDERRFYARLRVGSAAEFGVRLDDGGTANYAEIVLDPNETGAYVIDFRHKKAGAVETDTAGPTVVATQFSVVMLVYENDTINGRLMAEDGEEVNVTGFSSGTVSWVPSRVGFVGRGDAGVGDPVSSDWFYNTFE